MSAKLLVKFLVALYVFTNHTLSQYPGRGCSSHQGKCQIFKRFVGVGPASKFSTEAN